MRTLLGSLLAVVPLVVVALVGVVVAGSREFARLVRLDVEALVASSASPPAGLITEDTLVGLPEPVRRYLTYTGVVGRPFVGTVRLTQAGRIQPDVGQPWFGLRAQQHYSVRPPGFVWDATVRLGPFPVVRGRDTYSAGEGRMLIKALGLLPIADAAGPAMDQASMMRYLSEMAWFPTAFLGDNVSFEPVDDRSARVTLTDGGKSASALMHFDATGRLVEFVAERWHSAGGTSTLERWSVTVAEYGELAGLRLPVRGGAVWRLADGDVEYIDVTITDLQFDAGRHV